MYNLFLNQFHCCHEYSYQSAQLEFPTQQVPQQQIPIGYEGLLKQFILHKYTLPQTLYKVQSVKRKNQAYQAPLLSHNFKEGVH